MIYLFFLYFLSENLILLVEILSLHLMELLSCLGLIIICLIFVLLYIYIFLIFLFSLFFYSTFPSLLVYSLHILLKWNLKISKCIADVSKFSPCSLIIKKLLTFTHFNFMYSPSRRHFQFFLIIYLPRKPSSIYYVFYPTRYHCFNRVQLFETPWTETPCQASLSWSSLSPEVCSNSCPLSQWYSPTISFFVAPFSSCLQSFKASGSFLMSRLFASGGQSIGASAWVFQWIFRTDFL